MLSTQHNSVQLFKSYAGAKMIKPILVTLCDLAGWYFLKIAQPSLLLSSPCHLKYGWHVLHRRFNNGSILLNSHELLILILLLNSTKFFFRNPSNQKKLLNLHEGHHLWNLYESLGLLMVSNSARGTGNVFTVQIRIIHINIVACEMCQ